MAGASGFLGTALRVHLTSTGHEITQLVRGDPTRSDQARWDPYGCVLDPDLVAGADVVVNLAGVPIARWPWTASYKHRILESRLATTRTIADTIAVVNSAPALVNASGIGYYGDRGDEELDEDSPRGQGFLCDVTDQWEAATAAAEESGSRVAIIRTSVVLDASGGALKVMKLPFLAGVGGKFGSGRQWFPTISLHDYLAAVTRLATDDTLHGPFNVVAPTSVTNAEFTKALGQRLHRPTILPVPAFALKAVAGELSSEVLGSIRASPRRLLQAGFEFSHPTIGDQLDAALA